MGGWLGGRNRNIVLIGSKDKNRQTWARVVETGEEGMGIWKGCDVIYGGYQKNESEDNKSKQSEKSRGKRSNWGTNNQKITLKFKIDSRQRNYLNTLYLFR